MAKSTELELGALHGHLTRVITSQVLAQEEATEITIEGDIIGTGEMMFTATPALLAVAAKFLKDNSITSDIQLDGNLSGLRDALKAKQKHSRTTGTNAALSLVG